MKHPGDDKRVVPESLRRYLQTPRQGPAVGLVEELYAEALELLRVETFSRVMSREEFFASFAPYAEQSADITRLLADAGRVWLLAATIGPDLENRAKQYLRGRENFRGYILDRMGSYLVEGRVRELDREVSRECGAEGCACTHRFSPGYGDFSIQAQRIFVRLLDKAMPDLILSSGCILFPEKTVTAVKGAEISRAGAG